MSVSLRPISESEITLAVKSVTPMIQHQWSEKAAKMMRDKHAGKKTKTREVRDPQEEFEAATYRKADGQYAIPAMAFKASLIGAAHKDMGIEKTLVRKALFIKADNDLLIPIECDAPIMREDIVRVGAGAADLRYRPEFSWWRTSVTFIFDSELLKPDDIINLINRAGFSVGICEWRPEKAGEFGRFTVDSTQPVEVAA